MTGVQQPGSGSCDFETAAEHALTRVPVVSPSSSVEEIRGSLAQGAYDSLTHVAVVEGARLVGVLTVEALFSAPRGSFAREVMDPDPPAVAPGTSKNRGVPMPSERRTS